MRKNDGSDQVDLLFSRTLSRMEAKVQLKFRIYTQNVCVCVCVCVCLIRPFSVHWSLFLSFLFDGVVGRTIGLLKQSVLTDGYVIFRSLFSK